MDNMRYNDLNSGQLHDSKKCLREGYTIGLSIALGHKMVRVSLYNPIRLVFN